MACLSGFGPLSRWARALGYLVAAFALTCGLIGTSNAAELTFNRAYQGGLSGQTFTTTTALNADAGSIRFADGGGQRSFQNTSGTLYYTIGGVPYSETGVLNSRYPNGNTQMNAVAFSGTGGDRLLVLSGPYTTSGSYSGSSNAIVTKLNEYVDATAPDPAGTTLLVNGGASASASVGQSVTIVVTVKLSSGTAISGATVSLSASPSNLSSTSPSTTTTNSSGQATFTVTGVSSGTVTYNATAFANGTNTVSTSSVSVTYAGVRSAAQSSASVPAGTVGATTTVTITVRDGGGTPVAGAASGLSAAISGANAGASPSSITDQGSGTYKFTYVPTTAGTDSIAIKLDGAAISGSPYSSVVTAPTLVFAPTPGALPGGAVATAYSQTISVTGGTAPYDFTATGLPTGLAINASTGAITGTPTVAGSYSVTVGTTDAYGTTGSASYTIAIAVQAPVANAVSTSVAANSSSNAVTLDITGGAATSVAVASAASHGTASASGTSITYTPTAGYGGSDSFTYTATNASGTSAPATVSVTVGAPTLVFTPGPGSLPAGTIATAYSQAISVSGGTAPYGFSATGLPTGLTIDASTGAIAGAPSADGVYNVTVNTTDAHGTTGSASYTITVAVQAPVANAVSMSVAANSSSNAVTLNITGGAATSVAIASQASRGTASASGTSITYTPTAGYAGSDSFAYTATNASGTSSPATVTVTVGAPALVFTPAPGGLPGGTVGTGYSQAISVSAGTAPYSFTASGLPAGLTIDTSTGAITGTPTADGTYMVTVSATDAHGTTGSAAYSVAIAVQAPVANAVSASVAANSSNNAITLNFTGGAATSVAVASAASHGTASALGTSITYTPTAGYAGGDSFTYTATNASGTSGPATVSVTVGAPALVFTPTPGGLPGGTVGTSYSQTISVSAGTAPYSFTAHGLPAGLAINASTGAVTGTPTAAGSFTITVGVTDSHGTTGSASYTIEIAVEAPVANAVSASVAANSSGNAITLNITGGAATSVAIAGPATHGTASASGTAITYTPTAGYGGNDSFTYTATNTSGTSAAATVSVTVGAPTLVFDPAPGNLPGGTVGTAYSRAISVSGGTAPYSYAASGLPPGLAINASTGIVTGTPTTASSYSVTVNTTDAHGTAGTATYEIVIAVQAPVANPVSAVVAANSSNNAVTLNINGGTATSVAVASQPAHGTASATGTSIIYTPTAGYAGGDSFTYSATNASGTSAVATVSITVGAPTLVFGPTIGELAGGTVGAVYSQPLSVSGGTAPYSFTATGLPAGLAIDRATGAVTGTPATDGSFAITVSVTDAHGSTGSASYTIVVAPPPPPVAADSTSASVPANTTTQAGQNVGINLTSLVSGEFDEIRIIVQPKHGTVAISRSVALRGGGGAFMMAALGAASITVPSQVVAVYTPEENYHGADSFQFAAFGPGGQSAPATVSIQVVGQAPTAQAKTIGTTDGQMVSVELTTNATEGPFTDAAIVSVTPADQASATIVAGGAGAQRTFRLDVTPKAHFGGTVLVSYTLTNAFGVSQPATVTVTVTRRPDPSADPVVRAVSDAQGEAARRFSRAQVSNFMRRAEGLHGDCARSTNGLRLSSTEGSYDEGRLNGDDARTETGPTQGSRATDQSGEGKARTEAEAEERPANDLCGNSFAVWTGGTIEVATRDAVTRRAKISATTAGVSAGVDTRVAKGIAVGIGGGLAHDSSRIGDDKGRVTSNSTLVGLYASITPVQGMFLDGMIGQGWLDFQTKRTDATTGLPAAANREGRFTTGSLSAGIGRASGPLQWSLYGRAEYLEGTLDAYREQGVGIYDLRFDARNIRSTTGVFGFRTAYRHSLSFGFLSATLRGEWQHEFTGGTSQELDYADVAGTSLYKLADLGWSREQFLLAPAISLSLPSEWEFGLGVGLRAASGERAVSTGLQVRKRF